MKLPSRKITGDRALVSPSFAAFYDGNFDTIFLQKKIFRISSFFVCLYESRRRLNLTKKKSFVYSVCTIVPSAYIFHDEIFIVSKIYSPSPSLVSSHKRNIESRMSRLF